MILQAGSNLRDQPAPPAPAIAIGARPGSSEQRAGGFYQRRAGGARGRGAILRPLRFYVPGPRVPRYPQRGLTLIEILVTLVILSGGSVFVLQALGQGAQVLARAKTQLVVYQFARTKMADVEIGLRQGKELALRGRFQASGQEFRWRVHARPLEEPELELVTLTIDWNLGRYAYESNFSTVTRVPVEDEL